MTKNAVFYPKHPSMPHGTKSLSFMLTIFHATTKGLIYLFYVEQKQCTGPHKNSILAVKNSANKRLTFFLVSSLLLNIKQLSCNVQDVPYGILVMDNVHWIW